MGDGLYALGDTAVLEAAPASGYDFVDWSSRGAAVSLAASYSHPVSDTATITARFAVDTTRGLWSPGGTYSDWYFAGSAYESLEWTFIPVLDPGPSLAQKGLLHYYAYTFGVTGMSADVGGGYAGFQSNGIILGEYRGKVINYSIWGSNGGKSDGWVNPANSESGGWQLMYPYAWTEGGRYRFQLATGPSGTDEEGKWWGLWVTDLSTDETTFVGEQRVPAVIGGVDATKMQGHTAMFGEDLHWWHTFAGVPYHCGEFEPSAMAVVDVTMNGGTERPTSSAHFTSSGATSNEQLTNCAVTIYADEGGDMQHNLGFWPEPAPDGR